MDAKEFRRILTCFTDSPASLDLAKGEFVAQFRDELISARLFRRDGVLWVDENGDQQSASAWLVRRVARLSLLADRVLGEVKTTEHFVCPAGQVMPAVERDPNGMGVYKEDAVSACFQELSQRIPGTTSVIYLTSDAGEGKTTIINKLARDVASRYKNKELDWLLLPIPMGGRAFLRFDELVVSSLMQKYRFSYWYFEGFIELVRLGVVVPAFDGFEEMIVEESSGEAVSAVGSLVNRLDSEGTVLLAARKAFFEYQSFRTQARLFDAIGREDSVAFARISLQRWSKAQFIEYGRLRHHPDPEQIYDLVATRMGGDRHPLLTRAVLVKRLFDIATSLSEVDDLLTRLGSAPRDYFHEFVLAIITREVAEKWLDREGREGASLLSVSEHMDLLASVAREMWVSTTDVLRQDVVDVVADLYCEETKRSPAIARQVCERIKHHALLTHASGQRSGLSFDHEDFRNFFTGVALGQLCVSSHKEDLRSFLRVASIPDATADESLVIFERSGASQQVLIDRLIELADGELPTSFVLENAGKLLVRALDGHAPDSTLIVKAVNFGPSALLGRSLKNIDFVSCYFSPTGLVGTRLSDVKFVNCRFERLELESGLSDIMAEFTNCDIACLVTPSELTLFDPKEISLALQKCGLMVSSPLASGDGVLERPDEELLQTERAMRIFIRSTQVNEETIRLKLGNYGGLFMDSVVPQLERVGILQKIRYRGSGSQDRFRLGVAVTDVQNALTKSDGSFTKFISQFDESK